MINTLALNCKMVGKPANPYKALSPPWPPAKLLHMRGRLTGGAGAHEDLTTVHAEGVEYWSHRLSPI